MYTFVFEFPTVVSAYKSPLFMKNKVADPEPLFYVH